MFAFNRSNKRSFENETHSKLASLLLDEYVQVLSSFELNQIASLTYGTEVCDEIFEMLEEVLGKPLDYSTLALQKSLVVAKHILIYGSEECVRNSIALGRLVEPLQIYNTVLLQQQRQGATALFYRIKGGGVDKGYPVRDAAKQFYDLVANPDRMHQLRHSRADPNSLVPVGDDKVVFVTDEVRLHLLKKRMEEQQRMEAKSNLAKASDGFGSGYNSKDGKAVVGAAHGIEEMLAKEKREKMKYRDDGTGMEGTGYQAPNELLADAYAAVGGSDDLLSSNTIPKAKTSHAPVDLLDFSSSPQPTKASVSVDLLGGGHDLLGGGGHDPLGSLNGPSATTTGDLLGGGGGSLDFLGIGGGMDSSSTPSFLNGGTSSNLLVGSGGVVVDLLGVSSATPAPAPTRSTSASLDLLGMPPTIGANAQPSQHTTVNIGNSIFNNNNNSSKKPVMGSGAADPFSALDGLEVPSVAHKPTSTHLFAGAAAAEQRLLGLGGGGTKDPLSELNGLPDMTKLTINSNSNKPMMESGQVVMSKWGVVGGIMDDGGMSSDSESHGFGGTSMGGGGGGTLKPMHGGLTATFGLSATAATTATTTMAGNSSDPFSSLSAADHPTNNHIPSFAMPIMANPMSPSFPRPPIVQPAHGGMGVTTSSFGETQYGDNSTYAYDNHGAADDDDDNGFVMGGMLGSGLQPTAPPPPVPPPPPPAF